MRPRRAWAQVAWWLGPWAGRSAAPRDVTRTAIPLGGGSYVYRPAAGRARAAWLISPGMYLAGPDDPRADRFARVIASGGALVLSPRSPTLTGLRLGAGAIAELVAARAELAALPGARGLPLRVVAPSVGAMAALHLAADAAAAVERTVLIGGYVDAIALTRTLCGGDPVPRDPSSQATVFATFVDHLPRPIADRAALLAAWDGFVREVWSTRAWCQAGSTAHHAAARRRAVDVAPADRELFLLGCGATAGGDRLAAAAQATGAYDYMELRPLVPAIAGELVAFHGPRDAVIPVEQLATLAALAPRARCYRLTGLDHDGPGPLRRLFASGAPRALADEVRAYAALVDALVT